MGRVGIACIGLGVLLVAASASAGDASLLDVLRQKRILTGQEYRRLQGSELTPEQQQGLLTILRQKGVLSGEEAAALEKQGAAPAAAPSMPRPAPAVAAQPLPTRAPAEKQRPQLGYEDGFFVRTDDGSFALKFTGRVAANFAFFEPRTSQIDSETVDRARLGIEASAYDLFRMKLENDFAASTSGLRDAYIVFAPAAAFNLQIGQFKVPFSYEELMSKKYIDFVERAGVVTSTVNPSRDIGLMASGTLARKVLLYQIAVMNGAGQNVRDNNSDKDVIGRFVVSPFAAGGPGALRDLNLGGAVTYGNQPGDTFGTGATHSSIDGETESAFVFYPRVNRAGKRLREGGHLAWRYGAYSLSSEYIHTEEDRRDAMGAALPDLETNGAYAGGTWLLTGESRPFNKRLHPAHPLDLEHAGWGAWELALRWEFYKLRHGADAPTLEPVDGRYDAAVAGVNWYPNEFLRFSLNYLYGRFDDTGAGRSPNSDKHSNSSVLGRAQFEF